MGLDMYLKASKFVSGYDHAGDAEQKIYGDILAALGLSNEEVSTDSPDLTVAVNIAYWRKANAIHKWFVDNVQDGVDECQESLVTIEQLQELSDLCKTALKKKDEAAEVLPPQSGFFFGSEDVDEHYFETLQDTVDQLDKILKNKKFAKEWSFYYRSSW